VIMVPRFEVMITRSANSLGHRFHRGLDYISL
jgi:hypothetical protein